MSVPVARTRADLREARGALDGRVGVVMTMGALHDGHRSLIRLAREHADALVVTIFVNPLQFGAGEDLDGYPRTFDADLAACADEGVDLVFAPAPDVVYPDGEPVVRVTPGPLGDVLEGRTRPGHFVGVLTVVLKLVHLVRPGVAVFGQKDAQQLLLIRRMVRDLDLPVKVVAGPTVREPDGLALSSRNAYLTPEQRLAALALHRALTAGSDAAGDGPAAVLRAARRVLDAADGVRLDYLALVDPDTLADLVDGHDHALLAVAAGVGSTRLIDNVTMAVHSP